MGYSMRTYLLLISVQFVFIIAVRSAPNSSVETDDSLYSNTFDEGLPTIDNPTCEKSDDEIYLKFTNVGFKRIGRHFIDSSHVTCLSLDNNEIRKVFEEAFDLLPNLRFLDLSRNNIGQDNLFQFGSHPNLKTLVLDSVFGSFSRSYGRTVSYEERYRVTDLPLLPNLESLYLRNNDIKNFNSDLRKFTPKLKSLHLSRNSIGRNSRLSTLFDRLPPTLTHLSLDGNSVRDLSGGELKDLVYVNLNENNITQLCNKYCKLPSVSLRGATKLRYLSLSGNRLETVDGEAFNDAERLVHLDVSRNRIETFRDDSYVPFVRLRVLVLNDNLLRTVPDVCEMPRLRNLTLGNNRIRTIPEGAFCGSRTLRALSLDSNAISVVEDGAFRDLPSLEYLDLSGNRLSRLSDGWTLPSLHVLLVRDNLFASFDDIHLSNATSLTELHVEGNPITNLNAQDLARLATNVSVHFQNLKCRTPKPDYSTESYESSTKPYGSTDMFYD